MTKRRTTGGPRAHRLTEDDIKRRKGYKSRAERDHMWERRFMAGAIVLVVASVLMLGGAILYEQVLKPRQAISTVNGASISTNDFQDRVRFMRWLTAQQIRDFYYLTGGDINTIQQYASQQLNELQNPTSMGSQVLSEMEEELVIKQAAQEMGITADQAAVDEQVNNYMAQRVGLEPPVQETATPTTTPTITPTPLVSPTPTNTPQPTNTPTITPTPLVSPTPTNATPVPTSTPGPSLTPSLTPTPTITLTPSITPTPSDTPTPTATLEPSQIVATLDQEANDFYKQANSAVSVSRNEVRQIFYYDALRKAVLDELSKDIPPDQLQVNSRHILFAFNPDNPSDPTPPTDEQKAAAKARAEAALAALKDGEPFADLAKAESNDTTSGALGGELGWASPDTYDPAFKDAVLNATIGEIIGPIETQFGYHIIQVEAREVRTLSSSDLNNLRQTAYQDWLNGKKNDAKITRRSDWLSRIPTNPTYNSLLGDILPISQ
jgi:parvulin-like peptidyl-prolyl isomerase